MWAGAAPARAPEHGAFAPARDGSCAQPATGARLSGCHATRRHGREPPESNTDGAPARTCFPEVAARDSPRASSTGAAERRPCQPGAPTNHFTISAPECPDHPNDRDSTAPHSNRVAGGAAHGDRPFIVCGVCCNHWLGRRRTRTRTSTTVACELLHVAIHYLARFAPPSRLARPRATAVD